MFSALQLEKVAVRSLEATLHENVSPDNAEDRPTNYNIESHFGLGIGPILEDSVYFGVTYGVTFIGEETKSGEWPRFSRVGFNIHGGFTFPAAVNPDEIQRELIINCLAILYGVGRGLVISATGASLGGAFVLPSVEQKLMLADFEEENVHQGVDQSLEYLRKTVREFQAGLPKVLSAKSSKAPAQIKPEAAATKSLPAPARAKRTRKVK